MTSLIELTFSFLFNSFKSVAEIKQNNRFKKKEMHYEGIDLERGVIGSNLDMKLTYFPPKRLLAKIKTNNPRINPTEAILPFQISA